MRNLEVDMNNQDESPPQYFEVNDDVNSLGTAQIAAIIFITGNKTESQGVFPGRPEVYSIDI